MGINEMIEKFFQNVLELKNIPRQGWKEKLGINNPESVADHSYSTTVMSMILSDLEGLNSEKIIKMALLHDLAESIIGDIIPDNIAKNEKVKRIDHGIRCLEDEKLVERLRDDQIPLTVCPLSNIKLRIFKKLRNHNLKKLLNKGLVVMVNSDDPAYFGGYLNRNLIECQMSLNLTKEDIKRLAINSFRSSFLSEDKKKKWIDQINNLV